MTEAPDPGWVDKIRERYQPPAAADLRYDWSERHNRGGRQHASANVEAVPSDELAQRRHAELTYAELSSLAQHRADEWVQRAVDGIATELAASAGWGEQERDPAGRGWEKLQADSALRLAAIAAAPWNGYTLVEAQAAFLAAAPVGGRWTPRDRDYKWQSQVGRGQLVPMPSGVRDAVEHPGCRPDVEVVDPSDLLGTAGSSAENSAVASAAGDGAEVATRHVVFTRASDIKPRRVRWLWDGRVAFGTLALVAGREGLGKSTAVYWIVAQITRGQLPGEASGQPRDVLVCATEDSWDYTVVPRLIAAGADLQLVHRVEVRTADDIAVGLSLPRDLAQLEAGARDLGAALLVLDPLMSRLDGALDTHRDSDVRRALEPVVALADRVGMAVVGLIHHNKSGTSDPLQVVMGSRAFTAVARSVHSVIPDPDDEAELRRLFGTPKNNLGRIDLPTLSFTVVSHPVETDDGTAWTGRLEWGAESASTIGEAMRAASVSADDRSATAEAAEWLEDYLQAKGGQAASGDVKRAGAAAGHSVDALKRARRKLDLRIESSGFPRVTYWHCRSESDVAAQLEQQLEHPPRGEHLTALTEPTTGRQPQSEQLEQLEQLSRRGAPTDPPTASPTVPDQRGESGEGQR